MKGKNCLPYSVAKGSMYCTIKYESADSNESADVLLVIFGEGVAGFILSKLLCEGSRLVEFASLQSIKIFVCFQFAFGNLQHFYCHIGTVIRGTLAGGQQIFQYEAILYSAKTIS